MKRGGREQGKPDMVWDIAVVELFLRRCRSCSVSSLPRGKKKEKTEMTKNSQGWIDSATPRNLQTSPNRICSSLLKAFVHPIFAHPFILSLWLWFGFSLKLYGWLSQAGAKPAWGFHLDWKLWFSTEGVICFSVKNRSLLQIWVRFDLWTTVLVFHCSTQDYSSA